MFSINVVVAGLVAFATVIPFVPAAAHDGLTYTGKTSWDEDTGAVVFLTSGEMPDSKEDFFWSVPAKVKWITIGADVTVTSGFRVGYRDEKNPLHISGADRETSVIYGTDSEGWTDKNGVIENDKWKYGSVNVLADATIHVSNLTARNLRGHTISGDADRAVIHVNDCNLVDTRPGDNNNSDGFIGAAGSSIRNSFISTSDDRIKIYSRHRSRERHHRAEAERSTDPVRLGRRDR
jgi:hypothetical protein